MNNTNSNILNEYNVEFNNKIINMYDLSKIINIGDTFCNAPLNIKILNIFIKEVKNNLRNSTLSYSLYDKDNKVRIFGIFN